MKKRIITLLAVLALLVTCAVFAVQADDTTTTTTVWDELCPCGCGSKLNEVEWKIWGTAPAELSEAYINAGFTADDYLGNYGTATRHLIMSGAPDEMMVLTGTLDETDSRYKLVIKLGLNGESYLGNKTNETRSFSTTDAEGIKGNQDIWFIGNDYDGDVPTATLLYRAATGNGGFMNIYDGCNVSFKNVTIRPAKNGEQGITTAEYGTPTSGGAFYVNTNSTLTLENCVVNGLGTTNVKCSAQGGLIYNKGTVSMTNTILVNGTAATGGGGIYNNGGTVTMAGGAINKCATTGGNGGQVYQGGKAATFTMTGSATIKANSASTGNSDGLRLQGGVFTMQGTSKIESTGDGYNTGNGAYVIATASPCDLVLEDSASIVGPKNDEFKGNIKLQKYTLSGTTYTPSLKFVNGWKGKTSIAFCGTSTAQLAVAANDTSVHETYAKFYTKDATTGALTASTSAKPGTGYEFYSEYDTNMCPKFQVYNGNLMSFRTVVMKADGSHVWYIDVPNAINAAANLDGAYVKLMCNRAINTNRTGTSATTPNSAVIDLNGQTVNVADTKEGFTYNFIDTSGTSTKAPSGKVTFTTAAHADNVAAITELNGKTYLKKVTEGAVSAHELVYKIASVSLRPTTEMASLYFTANIACSDMSLVKNWGIAVTTTETDSKNLDADYLYTQETEAVEDNAYNGVLIQGIAKNGEASNATNANTTIYAKAYVTLNDTDGTVLMNAAPVQTLKSVVASVVAAELTDEAQIAARTAMQATAWYTDVTAIVEE